jgi:hypothetical protein
MYRVTITAKSEQARSMTSYIGRNSTPWTTYSGYSGLSLTPAWGTSSYTFTMTHNTDNSARLVFDIGYSDHNIVISHVAVDKIIIQTSSDETGFNHGQTKVFPNPFTHRINIDNLAPNNHIAMYDITGKLIVNQLTHDNSFSLDTEALHAGFYILRLSGGQSHQYFKLLKNLLTQLLFIYSILYNDL